ncbi:MAG TPA: ParB/RepB/Spo0J family partition protein [Allosphingosinicella sp.]|nr:ParB/RepB/Spo0J family partition protein [Allosphingosinicella sp.]
MIRTIPLAKLIPSARNVRRRIDEQADLQLRADIAARGLLQNLVVTSVKKPRGCFAVEAGGRRLAALQALAAEGALPRNFEVNCLVLQDSDTAQEASLAENFQRLSMNPADECTAFSALVEAGADVEGVARRFGLTERFVEGRLRLAGLAPVIFDALGAGEISLDVAKAYAATPDRERQEHVFEQMRHYHSTSPDSVRRMMTQATVAATDRRALFVGEQAYVAAGGRIERDLFTGDAEARWLDIAILERLAFEKLAAAAADAQAASRLAFVRPTLDSWIGHGQTEGLRRVPLTPVPLTDDENEEVERLDDEIAELVNALEHQELEEARRADIEMQVRALGTKLETLIDRPPVPGDELKPTLGAFLVLDDEGRPKLDSVYYAEMSADAEEGAPEEIGHEAAGAQPVEAGKAPALSQRLVDELAMQRRDVLAVHIAADPGFALDLAIFLMIDREAVYSSERSGSSLIAMAPANPVLDFETPGAPASVARAETAEALDRSWAEGATRSERFDRFCALGEEARIAWLGYAVAKTMEASLNHAGGRYCAFHDHLGQLLAIDVARWWRPTGANYFDRVPKALALEALADVGGAAFAAPYAKAKKVELAETCERVFAGDFICDAEVKQAALAWVPKVMRFAVPATKALPEDDGEVRPPVESDVPPWEERPGAESRGSDLERMDEAA